MLHAFKLQIYDSLTYFDCGYGTWCKHAVIAATLNLLMGALCICAQILHQAGKWLHN